MTEFARKILGAPKYLNLCHCVLADHKLNKYGTYEFRKKYRHKTCITKVQTNLFEFSND